MKFLLCGCFHGKVPKRFFKVIEKENPNLIICTGDFSDGKNIRKWEFSHSKEIKEMILKGKEVQEIIKFYKIFEERLKNN